MRGLCRAVGRGRSSAVHQCGEGTWTFIRLRVSHALGGGRRHRAVNWMAYAYHGTVEFFRQHHGTVDAREITFWVLFTQALANVAAPGQELHDREKPAR